MILGATGMLGHKLVHVLSSEFQVVGTVRRDVAPPELDGYQIRHGVHADRFDTVQEALNAESPDLVVNCIGLIKQLKPSRLDQLLINSVFPQRLAELARKGNFRLIHISTDCVFSGRKGGYKESDPSDAEDDYGRTKFLGEVDGPGCLTLRTSIIGRELSGGYGLIDWFYRQAGGTVKGFKGAVYTGLTTLALARVIASVARSYPELVGLWQVASESITKYDLLSKVNRQAGLGVTIEPDTDFQCDRSLDGSRFEQETGFRLPAWDEMIEELVADAKTYNSGVQS